MDLTTLRTPPADTVLSSEHQPRRRKPSLTHMLKEEPARNEPTSGLTSAQLLARALINPAKKGNEVAIKQILDREDGPAPSRVEGAGAQAGRGGKNSVDGLYSCHQFTASSWKSVNWGSVTVRKTNRMPT